jgi:hypothetical protein
MDRCELSPDGSAIPTPQELQLPGEKNDEMNFNFPLDAFSWKTMQPTAGRRNVSLSFMKTHPLQSTLALASGD